MPIDSRTARAFLDQMLASHSAETLAERLAPKHHEAPPRPTAGMQFTPEAIARRWALFPDLDAARAALLDPQAVADAELYGRNVEYFMGTVKVPVSVAGDARWRTLREIVTGGGPVFPELLRRSREVAPAARILAAYGSTEAEPIAELDAAALDALTLPPNTPGEIVVSGAHVLTSYWAGRGDEETKFRIGDAVWHRTGDVGYRDDDGRLWLLGRAAAVISDDRGRCHPFAVECAVGERWPGPRSAMVAHRAERVLVVERNATRAPPALRAIRDALPWAALDDVIECDKLPTDRRHNSKIDYPALVAWLDLVRS